MEQDDDDYEYEVEFEYYNDLDPEEEADHDIDIAEYLSRGEAIAETSFLYNEMGVSGTHGDSTFAFDDGASLGTDPAGNGVYHESLLEMIDNFKFLDKDHHARTATMSSSNTGSGYSFLDHYQTDSSTTSAVAERSIPVGKKKSNLSVVASSPSITSSEPVLDQITEREDLQLKGKSNNPQFIPSRRQDVDREESEVNPFIPNSLESSSIKRASLDATSLLPPKISQSAYQETIQKSSYRILIMDAMKKQQDAQMLMRSVGRSDIAKQIPERRPNASEVRMHQQQQPPSMKSNIPLTSPATHSRSASPKVDSADRAARQDRLTALGIFELDPKTKATATAIDATKTPISSFSTPAHQRPVPLSKAKDITAPKLISTSSKILTVPLTEIWADMKLAGKRV